MKLVIFARPSETRDRSGNALSFTSPNVGPASLLTVDRCSLRSVDARRACRRHVTADAANAAMFGTVILIEGDTILKGPVSADLGRLQTILLGNLIDGGLRHAEVAGLVGFEMIPIGSVVKTAATCDNVPLRRAVCRDMVNIRLDDMNAGGVGLVVYVYNRIDEHLLRLVHVVVIGDEGLEPKGDIVSAERRIIDRCAHVGTSNALAA
jgi:hypothetical protein